MSSVSSGFGFNAGTNVKHGTLVSFEFMVLSQTSVYQYLRFSVDFLTYEDIAFLIVPLRICLFSQSRGSDQSSSSHPVPILAFLKQVGLKGNFHSILLL
jgi:hypothetical protein